MVGIKIQKFGNSLGITFSKEVIEALNIVEGDELYVLRTERGLELTTHDPAFAEEMEAYQHVVKRHRDALRELSK